MALSGLRVVEFAAPLGAYAGRLFAGLGADVVLVEPPGGGPLRARGLLHQALNGGKRSIVLAPETAQARRLAEGADLVIAGAPLPFDPRAANPALVVMQLSPFGTDGPYAGWQAEDITALALGGMLTLAGYPGAPPIAACGEQAIGAASLFGAVGAMAALLRAEATGVGATVDVSMQECVAMGQENAIQFLELEGVVRGRNAGGQRQAGTGVFACRDGHVYLMAGGIASNRFWGATVQWLEDAGAPGAAALREPKWDDPAWLNTAEAKHIFATLWEPIARAHSKAELNAEAKRRRIPLAPVATARDILASEQLQARGYFVEQDGLRVPGAPYRLSATPWRAPGPAPALDEHREAVLRDIRPPPAPRIASPGAPLAGLRVADFTWIGAGAYATRLLADLGADVIKIESATRLDTLRDAKPFKDGKRGVNRSGYFADRNCGKRSITLDLKHPDGLRIARELVARADVVANNFSPGVMERLGLGFDAVQAMNPGAIYLAMSMQGATGPEADSRGYGLTITALTGFQHLTALPGRDPAGTGTNYPDHIPNPTHAVFAVLAALRHRRATGQGQSIDVAQTEPTIAMLAPILMQAQRDGTDPAPLGNVHPQLLLQGVFPCAGDDRWIAISLRDARDAAVCARILGTADADALPVATRAHDAQALMHALQAAGVPAGAVQTSAEVLADPQLRHRGHFAALPHAEMGLSHYNALPFTMQGLPRHPRHAAPLLGEHTAKICAELGVTAPPEALQ